MLKFRNHFVVIITCLFYLFIYLGHITHADHLPEKTPEILVIYSSQTGEINEHQRLLDMLLGRFSNNIQFISSLELETTDVEQTDVLFYYGQTKEALPQTVTECFDVFEGITVAIGENVEQLGDRFAFIERISDRGIIDQVIQTDSEKQISFEPQYVLNIALAEEYKPDVLMAGKKGTDEFPLFVRNETDFYFASHLLRKPFSLLLGEALYDVFMVDFMQKENSTPAYLRLEDVHPLVDPVPLMKIANMLKEKQIPYMIAVIPVYTNPETKKQYHLSDYPKLLKALKYMQNNGGSVVLHGYTHQFRLSETGEGFEFWDVEHNMPIYHGVDDKVVVKTQSDFATEEKYKSYVATQKAFERVYIEERLTKGIEELVNYGLYPLAFEAPHYTMSQQGYNIASEFFSTYVGQLQLSDEDWEIMDTAPYITKPTFLHGMTLLPETIGYVNPDEPKAIETMLDHATNYQFVTDGLVAGFYHPYLGFELFVELLEKLEEIPQIHWIDLKQMDNHVRTDLVEITSENGEIITNINHFGLFSTSYNYVDYHIKNIITIILWIIAMMGSIAVLTFIVCILMNKHREIQAERGEYS